VRRGYTRSCYDFPEEAHIPPVLRATAEKLEEDLPYGVGLYGFRITPYKNTSAPEGIALGVVYETKDEEVEKAS